MQFFGHLLTHALQTFVVFFCLVLLIINNKQVDGKICGDIDVRNDPWELETKLRSCTTVIGSISIVLIERFNGTDFNQYRFPELKEITGYLLLFRVFGLKSLRSVFPNLSIIRGERLISHYALIIYEMSDLTEIGLLSLIKIQRGYVMIRYCPVLCYVHTINWEAITQVNIGSGLGNYLDYDSFDACPTSKACPESCPLKNCWNNNHCQLFDTGKSNTIKNLVCHEECIGGCTNPTPRGCRLCRNFRSLEDNTCVRECPPDQYAYSSLCVSAAYCTERRKKPIFGECRDSCPLIISEKNVNITDVEQCARECPATEVDSLATSDLLRGCQIVKGDIYIRLQSGVANTMQILERNLGDIEEIEGILKIYRSPVITSLSFLKNLRTIRGISAENTKYTFIIMSNENLQELWDFNEKKTLQLAKGNLLVHFNNKLCLEQIHELQQLLKTNTTEDFISADSNGYEQTCSAKSIPTTYKVLSSTSVQITWQKIKISAAERIVANIVYYIVAPSKNVTHLGIDTCVQYGWQTHIIPNINSDTDFHSTEIGNLTQNTQYAYYVKTQVVPKDHEDDVFGISQGQSNIEYFTTKPDIPTYPDVETISKTSSSLTLGWSPTNDNEFIEYYRVDVFIQPDEHEFLDSRDYCQDPRVDAHATSINVEISESPAAVYQSCNNEFENWKINHPDAIDPEYEWRKYRKAMCASRLTHDEHQMQIFRYVKNHKLRSCGETDRRCHERNDFDSYRFSRQIHNFVTTNEASDFNIEETDAIKFGSNYMFSSVYPSTVLNTTFDSLDPYTMYIFQFFACNLVSCSSYFLYYDRTDSSLHADDIQLTISTDPLNSNRVFLDFADPPKPNGLTVAFHIEIHDFNTFKTTTKCITRKQHYDNGKRYTFEHLNKGQYIIRVRSVSLAMLGAYTESQYINVYDQSSSIMGTIGVIFVCLLFGTLLGTIVIYFYRHGRRRFRVRSLNASTQNIMMQMDDLTQSGSPQDEEAPSFYQKHRERDFF